jgi:hypothetical protein
MTNWAGKGTSGAANGAGTNAFFNSPQGVYVDRTGAMIVPDNGQFNIRRIVPTKTAIPALTTVTGTWGYVSALRTISTTSPASANPPLGISQLSGICGDTSDNLYIYGRTSTTAQRILKYAHSFAPISTVVATADSNAFSAFAGTGTRASTDITFGWSNTLGDGGQATSAFIYQTAVCSMDPVSGIFYFTTSGDSKIRQVAKDGKISTFSNQLPGTQTTLGDNGPITSANMNTPFGLFRYKNNKNMFVSEYNGNVIRRIDMTTNKIFAYAGTGMQFLFPFFYS